MSLSEDELWSAEEIPEDAVLYYRVHKNFQENGKPKPAAFKNRPPEGKPLSPDDGMSTDWNLYSSAHLLLQKAKIPADNIIIGLRVGATRQVPLQSVEHTPIQCCPELPEGNRAHTDVKGEKKNNPEVRLKLMQIYWVALRSLEETEISEEQYRRDNAN